MLTTGAEHAVRDGLADLTEQVGIAARRELTRHGVTYAQLRANLDARRWQRLGSAIVLHPGPLTDEQRALAACLNCGPRAVLTAFTAAALYGLRNWFRRTIHVLVPAGTRPPALPGLPIRIHRVENWAEVRAQSTRSLHQLGPALIIAATTFDEPRPACAILAAAVQQRIATVAHLRAALTPATRARHRQAMATALDDIEQGAQALSEIDFVGLCRRYRLPQPDQQTIRTDRAGRRRYLDATWKLANGRLLVVEVDGALHLNFENWCNDQLRQNDIALDGALILRFPSIVVRHEPDVVARQLRIALGLADRSCKDDARASFLHQRSVNVGD
jgi:hypothetical protein